MRLTFPRTLGFAAVGTFAALGFAGAAEAGDLSYTSTCGPDGSTIVTIHATDHVVPTFNGNPGVEIPPPPGAPAEQRTFDYTTGPGTVDVIWYGPASHDPTVTVEWGRKSITVPALTDCAPEQTPTTQGQPTTSEAPSTTPPPPASTIDQGTTIPPQQTSACEQERDEGNDICNLGTPAPQIGLGQELPATGFGDTLLIAGIVVLVAGSALMLVRRRPA
jgi:LPXTG-motif cell wall-anchored protein